MPPAPFEMRNFYKDKDLSAIVHTSLKTFTLQLCVCACSFLLSQQTAPSLSFSRLEETEIDVIWNSVRKKKKLDKSKAVNTPQVNTRFCKPLRNLPLGDHTLRPSPNENHSTLHPGMTARTEGWGQAAGDTQRNRW